MWQIKRRVPPSRFWEQDPALSCHRFSSLLCMFGPLLFLHCFETVGWWEERHATCKNYRTSNFQRKIEAGYRRDEYILLLLPLPTPPRLLLRLRILLLLLLSTTTTAATAAACCCCCCRRCSHQGRHKLRIASATDLPGNACYCYCCHSCHVQDCKARMVTSYMQKQQEGPKKSENVKTV